MIRVTCAGTTRPEWETQQRCSLSKGWGSFSGACVEGTGMVVPTKRKRGALKGLRRCTKTGCQYPVLETGGARPH